MKDKLLDLVNQIKEDNFEVFIETAQDVNFTEEDRCTTEAFSYTNTLMNTEELKFLTAWITTCDKCTKENGVFGGESTVFLKVVDDPENTLECMFDNPLSPKRYVTDGEDYWITIEQILVIAYDNEWNNGVVCKKLSRYLNQFLISEKIK